jgi:hypothetical protein
MAPHFCAESGHVVENSGEIYHRADRDSARQEKPESAAWLFLSRADGSLETTAASSQAHSHTHDNYKQYVANDSE